MRHKQNDTLAIKNLLRRDVAVSRKWVCRDAGYFAEVTINLY
jgi:hypothetical protein